MSRPTAQAEPARRSCPSSSTALRRANRASSAAPLRHPLSTSAASQGSPRCFSPALTSCSHPPRSSPLLFRTRTSSRLRPWAGASPTAATRTSAPLTRAARELLRVVCLLLGASSPSLGSSLPSSCSTLLARTRLRACLVPSSLRLQQTPLSSLCRRARYFPHFLRARDSRTYPGPCARQSRQHEGAFTCAWSERSAPAQL
mmetsp:Transcript_4752/g.15058  ORF Transcript_4752/g.15058 Transcript_4752/m.15058 type:complete len:201 (+) Transcript_4752:446-1048(+)